MGDVNHRCAHQRKEEEEEEEEEEETCTEDIARKGKKKEKTCNKEWLLLSFSIYRYCDTQASRVMHVHLTLFVFFSSLSLSLSRSLFHRRYLCLLVSLVDG